MILSRPVLVKKVTPGDAESSRFVWSDMIYAACQPLVISGNIYKGRSRWSISHYFEIDLFKSLRVVFPGVLFNSLVTSILTQAAALLWIVDQFQRCLGKLVDIPWLNQ